MPDAYEQIRRNLATHAEWPQSFCGRLAEDCDWDVGEFWVLHASLVDAAGVENTGPSIDRWLALAVCTIQQRVLQSVSAHYNANDLVMIGGVSAEELYLFLERFEHAVIGVFSGENLPEASFDLVNPLRRDA